LGLVALGLGLLQARNGAVALRLQRIDLPLRQFERRLRAVQRGLLLLQLRGVILGVLNGARDCLCQVLIPRRLLLCKHQGRLCLVHLCLVGADLGLLHSQLCIDVLNIGPCGGHLRPGLGEGGAVGAIVDAGDHISGIDMLVVGDRDRRDVARYLGGDRKLARRDVGVVGVLKMTGVIPVEVAGW